MEANNKLKSDLKAIEELHESMVKSLQGNLKEMTSLKVRAEAEIRILENEIQMNQEAYNSNIEKINTEHMQEIEKKIIEI